MKFREHFFYMKEINDDFLDLRVADFEVFQFLFVLGTRNEKISHLK